MVRLDLLDQRRVARLLQALDVGVHLGEVGDVARRRVPRDVHVHAVVELHQLDLSRHVPLLDPMASSAVLLRIVVVPVVAGAVVVVVMVAVVRAVVVVDVIFVQFVLIAVVCAVVFRNQVEFVRNQLAQFASLRLPVATIVREDDQQRFLAVGRRHVEVEVGAARQSVCRLDAHLDGLDPHPRHRPRPQRRRHRERLPAAVTTVDVLRRYEAVTLVARLRVNVLRHDLQPTRTYRSLSAETRPGADPGGSRVSDDPTIRLWRGV